MLLLLLILRRETTAKVEVRNVVRQATKPAELRWRLDGVLLLSKTGIMSVFGFSSKLQASTCSFWVIVKVCSGRCLWRGLGLSFNSLSFRLLFFDMSPLRASIGIE